MRRFGLGLSLALVAGGCGSRSPLALGSGGEGGAAGAPAGTGGTSVSACSALSPRAPVLTLPGATASELDDALGLVPLDAGDVAGAFVRKGDDGSLRVLHTRFSPWAEWPPEVSTGSVHSTSLVVDDTPKLARAAAGGYAMAARFDPGPRLYPAIEPTTSGSGATPIALAGIDAMFVASNETRFLTGTFSPNVSHGTAISGGSVVSSFDLGCAASSGQPVTAGAVEWGGGFLVAASSAVPFGGCADPTANGPATRIEIVAVDANGVASSVTGADVGGTVISLRTAPHPDGLFVAYTVSGASAGPTLRLARVDLAQAKWVGPVGVGAPGEQPGGFAVAALGSRVAVARKVQSATATQRVSVFDAALGEVATGSDSPPLASIPTDALGSPDGGSLLVAWTSNGSSEFRVHVTRFDCVP